MNSIIFIDTEIEPKSGKILDIGCVSDDGSYFHKGSVPEFLQFIKGAHYICGHNIFNHDLKYIGKYLTESGFDISNCIDTLFLSPLLFPKKPYHALLKDDKLQSDERNNPVNDSKKARDLFYDEVATFKQTDELLKRIFYHLLKQQDQFQAFFRMISYEDHNVGIEELIHQKFANEFCQSIDLNKIIQEHSTELAYCLSLINSFVENHNVRSITPPWVLRKYPEVERLMLRLRNKPCLTGCSYCNRRLDVHGGLKRFFGFDTYRTYGGEPLQEKAVQAAVNGKSILAVFPTGGGKSITFQVPALMSGENSNGLTVVISPLQSLMKDQVDNLEKSYIVEAVTINGLMDPIERQKSFDRVEDGSACMLYISPESLRSPSIERLIIGRKVVRFVIDEAHCFSSWGQDFRVDYLYIGDFIKRIQDKKAVEDIPVSCFTATAKQRVIEDIRDYFKHKLSLELELFTSNASRTNLHYQVFEKSDEEQKYATARDLIKEKSCPAIIYVSRTRKAYLLAAKFTLDGFAAKPYHGKMEGKEKTENQNAFISGETQIMVATSAFGMGVDKKDVGLVIHYDISDSLENYVQEAGRAGRDENISADCYVLFNEEDLSKHFVLLNQTKLSIKEIQQIWKAIKEITRFRSTVSDSALEIARKAGWDDSVAEIETRVKTAIAALEDAGYLKRGQNMPKVFANSILSKNAQEAINKINNSEKFDIKQKEKAIRIIKKLFSSKSKSQANTEEAESRIDYISDRLGIVKEEVINIVNLLREEEILADAKDLTAFVKKGENRNRSLSIVQSFSKIENFLLPLFELQEETFHIKELNEKAESIGCFDVTTNKLKTILNLWSIKHWIKYQSLEHTRNHFLIQCIQPKNVLNERLKNRHELAKFIVEYLYLKINQATQESENLKDEILVEFSIKELKDEFEKQPKLFDLKITLDDVEDTLFYLSRIEAIKIEGGFLVVYNKLTIERIEQDNYKKYTKDDYRKLSQFYENKAQQIHIVGEYANKMLSDYKDALQFVDDYFHLNYNSFLRKYYPGKRADELKLKMTPNKFKQLFGELSPTQLKIINDTESKIAVIAGPGSGKTRVLVHKLASLLLMEDVKHEQLLMLTFSRAAATEFKKRLLKLIGNAANYIEIKTFHSYCFDLLGRVGNLEKSGLILKKAVEKIKNREVETSRITKTVLVIDEAQDMDEDEFNLIKTLIEQNEDMRVIAVGDDDQNIYEFRGASAKYLEQFISFNKAIRHELVENYRSKANLVAFTNQFVATVHHRLKVNPIVPHQLTNGNIRIIHYQSSYLITPLVNDILRSDLVGTTCVLTKTNDEASQTVGLLLRHKVQAKLIQTNDGFNLYNLLELRFFLTSLNLSDGAFIITDEAWENAKRQFELKFQKSSQIEPCRNLIKAFEITNPKRKYKSDLEALIRESKLEDFFNEAGETIFVSTIHKAKGREFDNVVLMLDCFNASTDESKRLLYVAMTRAKQNLTIHLNSDILDRYSASQLERIQDEKVYTSPNELVMSLTLKDVWLDYFINKQSAVDELMSGSVLQVRQGECLNLKGEVVLKYSQNFNRQIEDLKIKNYKLKSAKVNFVVYWRKEGDDKEVKVILPHVYFEKDDYEK